MRNFNDSFSIGYFIELLQNTSEWKTLQDKTQVFNERRNSDVKSRGSHCYDVGKIASQLSEQLGGDSVTCDKANLIGLIHDLGHIPYGHAGESVADSIISNYKFSEEEIAQIKHIRKLMFGEEYAAANDKVCFEHNENSVLQYITLCNRFGFEPDKEIIIGILSHSTSRYKKLPPTLCQQAVRLADKLAYINYDVSDLFLSFEGKEEELNALTDMYKKPLLDPSGKEIKIPYNGKEYTLYEFLTELSVEERIESFISASVLDAKTQAGKGEYADFETVLTGCNDIAVKIADLRKKISKTEVETEKKEYEEKIAQLKSDLYKRNPVLYAAYEIKDRSDDFIRSGVGLSKESQVDRSMQSLSSVGNKDLMNEYFYKTIALYLQNEVKSNEGLTKDQILQKYHSMNMPQDYIDLYFRYLEFRQEQNSIVANLPGNNGTLYPEIYTIVNFVGIHSNTQLTELAKIANLDKRFEQEVLPQVQALLSNSDYYDSEKGIFTKAGNKEREKLVSKYGAKIQVEFGLEEENISPLAEDETIERTKNAGYDIPDYVPSSKKVTLDMFRKASSEAEKEHIAKELARVKSYSQEIEEYEEEKGRSI